MAPFFRLTRNRRLVALVGALGLAVGPTSACFHSGRLNPRAFPGDAASAQFVTDDVRRFWAAYDAGGKEGNAAAFQTMYLDPGSPGLRDFIQVRQLTAQSIAQVVTRYRAYYAALSPSFRDVQQYDEIFAEIRRGYARIDSLYPDAFFPPVTLLYGRFSTGATTGPHGLLLGLEFYGADAHAPTAELGLFARSNQFSLHRDLPALVAHEHAHMLQQAAGAPGGKRGRTLLAAALAEGGADFVAELAVGHASYAERFRAWESRELEFWQAFQREQQGTNLQRWLYNQGNGTAQWPGDLGYFIGYRIAQAYYIRASDKSAALRALIAQHDPAQLLRESGYDGRGPTLDRSSPK